MGTDKKTLENMAETEKQKIEIESKLMKQLQLISKYLQWTPEYLLNHILEREIKWFKGAILEQPDTFMSEYFDISGLISELKEIGD